uniref:Importin subunit alpha n=1 Tax=Sus scrofa TaxID=9823 RepID=A0A8D1JM19_PIG
MPILEAPEERLRKFKYRGKDASVRRQQRLAVSLELRKAKKDEQALKRRNITTASDPFVQQTKGAKLTLQEIIHGVNASDPEQCFQATQAARYRKTDLGIRVSPQIQARENWTWVNLNKAGMTKERAVVSCKGTTWEPPHAAGVALKKKKWLGDTAICISPLHPGLGAVSSFQVTFLRNIVWTLSNLCRNKNPCPCDNAVKQMLPVLSHLLQHRDSEVLSDTCWALSYLTDGCDERIGQVVDMGVLPRLVELMTSSELNVLTPSLRTVGNIVTGTDPQTQLAIDAGLLSVLPHLLLHPRSSIQKEAAWALSNVAAGPHQHIQQLIACGALPPLVALLKNGEFKVQKEAVWTVANFTTGGTVDQLVQLVQAGVLEPLINLLDIQDTKMVIIILDVIFFILQAAEKISQKENMCLLIEGLGGIDKIEALQLHENRQVALTALSIIERYFSEEEDAGTLSALLQDHECLTPLTKT